MITPSNPANEPEQMTFAEIRALLAETVQGLAETRKIVDGNSRGLAETRKIVDGNSRGIAEIRATTERQAKNIDRLLEAQDRTDAAITRLTEAQYRTNQDVSTLKGWGLELYCERNPEIFALALGLGDEELITKREIGRIASAASLAGVIAPDQRRSLIRADVFIYARRESDHQPVCLVVEASYKVDDDDVERAAGRAEILSAIIQKYQPRNLNGQVIPIVAGMDIETAASFRAKNFNVTYVQVQNGNQLTNPPE